MLSTLLVQRWRGSSGNVRLPNLPLVLVVDLMKLHCEFDIHIGVPANDITDAIFLSILYCIVPLLYCLSILCSIFCILFSMSSA